jgi:glycosyltransferase involved in cell wall biosynthesis
MKTKDKQHCLLHIMYDTSKDIGNVFGVCSPLTSQALKQAGYSVSTFVTNGHRNTFISDINKVIPMLSKVDIVLITIDGRAILDKFTLLKLFKPSLIMIWEIHGIPEELFWFDRGYHAKYRVFFTRLKRRLYSLLVSASFTLSESLQRYALNQLKIRRSFVTPSIIDDNLKNKINYKWSTHERFLFSPYQKKHNFIVFWYGTAGLRWHALDIIEEVAKRVYKKDKTILFVIVGSNKWHTFTFWNNIISYDSLPHNACLKLASYTDVCLALYKTDYQTITGIPFHYSPRKIVEYMGLGKPVIATGTESIKQLFDHDSGIITDNNVDEIVKIILHLKHNPERVKQIGQHALQTIRNSRTVSHAAYMYKNIFQNHIFRLNNSDL